MRFKYTVVVLLIVIAGTATTTTGQEEPLPAIQARGSVEPLGASLNPRIVLAVEPIRATSTPSLAEAVRANDYVTFDALYRAEPNPAFATLHELWTYSITDPIGAFYGPDMHARLARAYPAYSRYIEEFRIVDRNGNVFYPTSETRTFLLEQAMEGRAPRVLIAEPSRTTAPPVARTQVAESRTTEVAPRTASTPSRRATATPTGVAATTPTRTAAAPTRTATATATAAPATTRASSTPARSVAAAPVASTPASTNPVVASSPIAAAPITEAPVVVQASDSASTAAPIAVAPTTQAAQATQAATETVTPATEAPAAAEVQPIRADDSQFGSRGILLLVIGLIGIGLLAMMLRTPREVQPTSIITPEARVTPPPVEPIRRPSAAPQPPEQPQSQQQAPGKNRASGSHR